MKYAFQRLTLKHSLPNLPQQQKLLRLVQDGQQGADQILNHTLNEKLKTEGDALVQWFTPDNVN